MSKLKELKFARGQIKATVTRAQRNLEKYGRDSIDLVQIRVRREGLASKLREFEEVQGQIEILDTESDHEAERQNFEDAYYALLAEFDRLLHVVGAPSPAPSQQSAQSFDGNHVRLPRIELPCFRGSYEEWHPFRDTFISLIHNNPALSDIQKFHYLRASLKGEAADVTRSLEISAINYVEAWSMLTQRYDNKRLIVQTHIKALADLPAMHKENGVALRQLLDGALKHTRALKALKRPVEHWDDWLVYLIASKLDMITSKEWETKLSASNLPTFEQLIEFLTLRCQVLEAVTGKPSSMNTLFNNRQKSRQAVASHVVAKTFKCQICKGNHFIHQCERFLEMPVRDRVKEVMAKGLCLNCLRSSTHYADACNSGSCRKCDAKHNTLLHPSTVSSANVSAATDNVLGEAGVDAVVSNVSHRVRDGTVQHILLSTALIEVRDHKGKTVVARALLDSGSQSCFVTSNLAQRLKLKQRSFDVPVVGVNQTTTQACGQITITFKSRYNKFSRTVDCVVLKRITQNLPGITFNKQKFKIPDNVKLADPGFYQSSEVDILLGAEIFYDLLAIGQIRATRHHPCLQKSHLGWLVSGRVFNNSILPSSTACNLAAYDEGLERMVARFWEIDDSTTGVARTKDEKYCEELFEQTTKRNADGRFIVKLPTRLETLENLGNNRANALKRFYSLERKLNKQPELKRQYDLFLKEYESLGHMRLVQSKDINQSDRQYYMPHHAVMKESSSTTSLRVVFDASCKSETGVSLNAALMIGPNVQQDLFSIVVRFRTYAYVITADVAKMYRQVLVDESQTCLQRILWREDDSRSVNTYELLTVTYGTASASYLATRCLQEIAKAQEGEATIGAAVIQRDFYVDDLLTGANSISELNRIRDEVIGIVAQAGFVLRKWASNSPELLQNIPDQSASGKLLNLNKEDDVRTLGIRWNPNSDIFQYAIPATASKRITKRTILAAVARVFDPLGLIGPVIVTAKILIQRLWQLGLAWDESIPMDLHTIWSNYERQLTLLNNLKIYRHVICKDFAEIELHGFSDASQNSYGACIYMFSCNESESARGRLLCAKSRVAPLKSVSLPRLELCGALLLAKMMNKIIRTLGLRFDRVCCWSDSAVVLAWLRSPSRTWKTFVANRVSELQELLPTVTWGHVPSAQNPADLISRGVTPAELLESALWWEGPVSFLINREGSTRELLIDEVPERREISVACAVAAGETDRFEHEFRTYLFNKFSTLQRLIRVVAYCIRFIRNARPMSEKYKDALSNAELETSRTRLIRMCQAEAFSEDIATLSRKSDGLSKGILANLGPFIDNHGVLRVGGRLQNSNLDYGSKHPILLPRSHTLTRLIIEHEHRQTLHAGPQMTLAAVRANYWPISGKSAVRNVTRKCIRCFRNAPRHSSYLMGNLPKCRVTPSRPFANTGVDYCGPFLVKEGRRRSAKLSKSYAAIFVCMATKAVHIELVTDLSAESFIACLKRFMARRGKPANIYSDNGTNFVGANRVLKELQIQLFNDEVFSKINELLTIDGINWSFIPPGAPNFGGLWEAAVKSAKYHLRRIAGNSSLQFEELCTVFVQIEAVLNSRPITPLSSDPHDLHALTPAHFLIGDSLLSLAEPELTGTTINRLSRWQYIEQLRQHFWQRWSREYLNFLHQRPKGASTTSRPIREGDLVVIRDDNLPPLQWLLGRVTGIFPGQDGVVRTVSVKTAKGIIKRPTTKCCILPLEDN